jgi:protein involved in polysaccharide export with SLBB domain
MKRAPLLTAGGSAASAWACLIVAGCMSSPGPLGEPLTTSAGYPSWSAKDVSYRFYPGDKFRIDVRTAPELSGELTIAPDGRVTLPQLGAVMAANRSVPELQAMLEQTYARELIDPSLIVTPTGFGSQKIFVGGEVKSPGVFEMPGEIDALQAVLLAGGWTESGKPSHVVILRRAPGGQLMTRVLDVRAGSALSARDIGPLRRFDVVYVSRKAIVDENLFVKQFIRDALPIDFSLFYDVARF